MGKGFYTALGTPFDENGNFCAESMTIQIEQQIAAGASGLLVMGSMGNETYIRNSEYRKVAACSVSAAKGSCPVLIGVTDTSVGRVLDRITELSGIDGIDGVVSTVPYYSVVNQSEIFNFYTAIAEESPYPVYLYDLPSVTQTPIAPATIKKLWKHPNIRGIKSPGLVTLRTLKRSEERPENFRLFFSDLEQFDIAYIYGIDFNLDGMFSCTPVTSRRMYRCFEEGNTEEAGNCLDAILDLRRIFSASPSLMNAFSYAMNLIGCPGNFSVDYRDEISNTDMEKINEQMKKMGEI